MASDSPAPAAPAASAAPATPQQLVAAAVQVPPAADAQLTARVEHVLIAADGRLSDALSAQLLIPRALLLELMRFGSVYYAPVVPKPKDGSALGSAAHARALAAHRAGVEAWGRSTKLQVPRRVLTDQQATAGAYARIHMHPKRFPAAYAVQWRARVIHEGRDFVVVDKPPGVQVRRVAVCLGERGGVSC